MAGSILACKTRLPSVTVATKAVRLNAVAAMPGWLLLVLAEPLTEGKIVMERL